MVKRELNWFTEMIGKDIDRYLISTGKCILRMEIVNATHAQQLCDSQHIFYYQPADPDTPPPQLAHLFS